jgi:hypothetical protein
VIAQEAILHRFAFSGVHAVCDVAQEESALVVVVSGLHLQYFSLIHE